MKRFTLSSLSITASGVELELYVQPTCGGSTGRRLDVQHPTNRRYVLAYRNPSPGHFDLHDGPGGAMLGISADNLRWRIKTGKTTFFKESRLQPRNELVGFSRWLGR